MNSNANSDTLEMIQTVIGEAQSQGVKTLDLTFDVYVAPTREKLKVYMKVGFPEEEVEVKVNPSETPFMDKFVNQPKNNP